MRKEFLPVYAQDISHRVRCCDIPQYVRTFLAQGHVLAGTITIDLTDTDKLAKEPVDFAPLVRICKKNRALRIVIVRVGVPDLGYFDTYDVQFLLDYCIAEPTTLESMKWSRYFDKAVENLRISNAPGLVWSMSMRRRIPLYWVEAVVKSAYSEWWMGSLYPGQTTYKSCDNIARWAEKTGYHASWGLGRLRVRSVR